MAQKQEFFRPLRFCPKSQTWIFSDKCSLQDDCWDVPDYEACILMRNEVRKGTLLIEEFCEKSEMEET